jgi:hypothetical protein
MEEGSVSERIPDDEGHGGSGESGGAGGADEGDGSHSDESANTESDETTESEDDCTTRSKSKDAKNKKIPRTKGKMKMKNIAAVPGMDGRVRARRTRAMVEAEAEAAEKELLMQLEESEDRVNALCCAVVALFAAIMAGNARLRQHLISMAESDPATYAPQGALESAAVLLGLSPDQVESWVRNSLRDRHHRLLEAVQSSVCEVPMPDESSLQVILAEAIQERVRLQSAVDIATFPAKKEEETEAAAAERLRMTAALQKYEVLLAKLREQMRVEHAASQQAFDQYEAQIAALRTVRE